MTRREAAEKVFRYIRENKFEPTNIHYGNGYFIFDMGDEYYKVKIFISKKRVYDIINYKNNQYCIICTEKTGKLYAVEVNILDDELSLYLGKRILIEPYDHEIETRVFRKVTRIFNGRKIKNRI